jgi:hypothetical protein
VTPWSIAALGALGILAVVVVYIAVRWRCAPIAKRTMIGVGFSCTIAGITLGVVAMRKLMISIFRTLELEGSAHPITPFFSIERGQL